MADADIAPAVTPQHASIYIGPSNGGQHNDQPDTSASITDSTESANHPLNVPSAMENPAILRAASLSGPASKETTPNSSARDESQSESAAYSTRSRNRSTTTRPNYADDVEMDFEMPVAKPGTYADKRRSASSEIPAKTAPNSESKGPMIRLYTNSSAANGAAKPISSTKLPKPATSSTPDINSERKKRKYERQSIGHAADHSEGRSASGAAKDAIPGTSQFFAAPNGNAEAPPPPKKRKTGDDVNKSSLDSYHRRHEPRETSLITFEKHGSILKGGKLVADDGSTYSANDHVYLICEPPGDPYYFCRIMDFQYAEPDNPRTPVVSMLINWFYRPKDIGRYSSDYRFLFASMQSDSSPISSLRGKCQIEHRSQIEDLEEYRKGRDCFWFSQLYDRYSHRPYEIIPSSAVINVPENVKKALDENWKFLVVEQARQKELTSAVKLCKRCSRYCAPNDSVDCGVCRETYHMSCVDPPLSKKPSRGFAWSCGPCSRAQERKLEQRHAAVLPESSQLTQDEVMEDDEPDLVTTSNAPERPHSPAIPDPMPEKTENASANLWPWRYLGIHTRVEDVLQYDDRAIYPRASSRLGPRHQATTSPWFGQPVEFVKPSDLKKKAAKSSSKKDSKLSKEVLAAIDLERAERAKRPKWVQDEPQGYVARGEDFDASDPRCTATPLFIKPLPQQRPTSGFMAANARGPPNDKMVDEYINAATELGKGWGYVTVSKRGDPQVSTNFLDRALKVLSQNKFNFATSLDSLKSHHEPDMIGDVRFTKEEVRKFEDGAAKHGSDLRAIRKQFLKSKPHWQIVRFYYTWKFTQRGTEIWGNHQGRKGVKKRAQTSWIDIADDEDDSAFDNDKAITKKRRFHCNFCLTRSSRQWRRAPGVAAGQTVLADPKGGKDKANQLVVALCQRCAYLWRRYALAWEDPDDFAKSVIQSGGRAWKRRTDEEMLRDLVMANEATGVPTSIIAAQAAAAIGIIVTVPLEPKKKPKTHDGGDSTPNQEPPKKKPPPVVVPRPPTPPPEPVPPKWRELPCAVCRYLPLPTEQMLTCKECKLTVHSHCYAITDQANPSRWNYGCTLCPLANRPTDLLEPPKVTHKKKTDRDREKERLEKEMATKMEEDYFREQKRKGRPIYPREAVKLTAANNWVHVTCAIWTPEIRFSDGAKMQKAEGMGALLTIPARIEPTCKLCGISTGSCVSCHQCHVSFHVACAHEHGYKFGFDVAPVKGARKDSPWNVTVGEETGFMTAAIWCKEHTVKTIVHDMTEIVEPDTGKNVLQLFSELFKQADLGLTGTARKANLLAAATKGAAGHRGSSGGANRCISTMVNGTDHSKQPPAGNESMQGLVNGSSNLDLSERRCRSCGSDTTLRWHQDSAPLSNRVDGSHGPQWCCHKCYLKEESNMDITTVEDNAIELAEAPATAPDLFRANQNPPRSFMSAENLERFAQDLEPVVITLTNPVFGGLHVLKGKDFRLDLESDPNPLFRYMSHWAAIKCGYDQERDVIVTEDGSWVTWPKSMMQALVKILMVGATEAHWRIMSARDIPCKIMDTSHLTSLKMREYGGPGGQPHNSGYNIGPPPVGHTFHDYHPPPPPQPQGQRSGYPPHPVPGIHHGALPPPGSYPPAPGIPGVTPLRRPSITYGRPPELNGTGPPMTQPPAPGQPPNFPPADALHSLNQPPPFWSPGSGSSIPVGSTQASMQAASPPPTYGGPRPATPRDAGFSGASSSPNLRNILH